MKVQGKNGSGGFILLPSAHHQRNPHGNARRRASWGGNHHDAKLIMEKNGQPHKAVAIFPLLADRFGIGTKGFFNALWWRPGFQSITRWENVAPLQVMIIGKESFFCQCLHSGDVENLGWKIKSLHDEVWVFCDVVTYGFEFWFSPGAVRQDALSL